MSKSSVFSAQKVYVFSGSVLCLGKMNENPRPNSAWEERLAWFKISLEYRTLDRIDGEPIEFEWNIFPGCTTLQFSHKVQELLLRLGETPENSTGRITFMSMFNDISWGSKDNEKECESNAQLVSLLAKSFGAAQWSFLGPGSEKKWYSISEDSPQGEWDKMAEKMVVTLAESGHPVFRAMSPLSRGVLKSKGGGKLSIHYCVDQETITTVFPTITSVKQLSLYGTVAEMFEEYESYHDRTGRPIVGGQWSSSFVPSGISDPWNVAWPSDTHRRLEVLGDNKVVINWMNGAWEVKGEEHAIPVRGVVDQFVRWFLGGTFRPRTDENDGVGISFASQTKLRPHMLIG